MMKANTSFSLLLLFFFLSLALTSAQKFTCKGPITRCQSLLGYKTVNVTTYANLTSFFGIKSIYTLFGANNLSLTTVPSTPIKPNTTVTIPLPCTCSNNTGVSDHVPIHTVQPGESLSHITTDIFGGFVSFLDVAKANNVTNPDLIFPNETLWIPLPCSCDEVDGAKVVHYAHKVVKGSSIEKIAAEFGVSSATLMTLNGITDPKSLDADQILDVPLPACTGGSASNTQLASNGTYILTSNCTQCSCNLPGQLQCKPTNLQNVTCTSTTDEGQGNGTSTSPTTDKGQGNVASRPLGGKGFFWCLTWLSFPLPCFDICKYIYCIRDFG